MYYNDFVKELREIVTTGEPTNNFAVQLKYDLINAVRNLPADRAFGFLTRILDAAQEARDTAAENFISSLPFNRTSGEKYQGGKNFTSANNLVFRVTTKVDYNYAANDDLEPDYGMPIATLSSLHDKYARQSKLVTEMIATRKKLILARHPRMQPVEGSVHQSASFLGTWLEASRKSVKSND